MTERYINVSDDEYCYTLDTQAEDYKTLEDFEKIEFEQAKKDGLDIKEYEDAILLSAHDKYWEWVYNAHIEADTVNDLLNKLNNEKQEIFDYILSEIHFNDKKYIETEDDCFKYTSIMLSNILRNFGVII